ncbi:MAG TPA: DUF4157 domain-containing protein, partial [Kofleriaceae bacterium]|nr:DUF4157 domain-containing protein [Kofleriaceae bacterium]
MGKEHRFRDDRGVDRDAFDWATPAEELEIPLDDARALYEEALRRAMYPGSRPAEDLYLEWLAAWEPGESHSEPGRHALTMRLGQRQRREPARRSRVPGKRPLTAHLDGPRSFRAEARDRGAPREAQAPAQRPGWSWTLIEGGAQGAPLPGDVATRLGPHVGDEATRAARLHTDDTADQVAAAHRARAVAIGDAIYFARGEYAPGTARGDELLAHELTHVAQAQRGELTRAAAKGLESGGTLDPAEAEADLRARLAVIQLHAPAGAAPELAAPSGQPTSEGERAAKLAAQQQRLALADAAAPGAPAVPAAPTSSPQAPVPNPAPEMTAAPAAAKSGNAYVDTFAAPPSKQATELWDQAGTEATAQATADHAAFEAGLAPLPVALDGAEAPAAAGGDGPGHTPEQAPEDGVAPPATEPTPTPEAPAV